MPADLTFPMLFRWLHMLAAVIAVGGVVFARFALMPAIAETLGTEQREALVAAVRNRWRFFVMVSIALLLISGIANFMFRFSASGGELHPAYHVVFGLKFLLAIVVFFLASALVGRSGALGKIRDNAKFWAALTAILGLVIVALGGVLKNLP